MMRWPFRKVKLALLFRVVDRSPRQGGGGSLGSMVGIVGWLGVVGEVDGGLLGAAAASSNHECIAMTEKIIT